MDILRDPTGELTLQDVSSPAFAGRFFPNSQSVSNLGVTSDAIWVRWRVRNESATNEWRLALEDARLEQVALYIPLSGAPNYFEKVAGRDLPFTVRDVPHRNFVFRLNLPHGVEQTFYMRLKSASPLVIPLNISTVDALAQKDQQALLFLGLFYGAMLILAGYNLFLFFALRDTNYLYLALFIIFYSLGSAARDGLAQQYLWPSLPEPSFIPLLTALMLVFQIKFTMGILETRMRVPTIHRLLTGLLVICLVLGAASLFIPLKPVGNPVTALTLAIDGAAAFFVWRQGYRTARLYLVSWALFLVSGLAFVLSNLNYLSGLVIPESAVMAAAATGGLFWSLAIADRINLLRAEKEKANLEVQASETRYRQLVETMNEGLGVVDEDGRFIFVNNRLVRMLGYDDDEIIGHPVADFLDSTNQQIVTDQLALRRTGRNDPYELTWLRKDGSELFTNVSPMPLFGEDQRYKGAFAVITDITERVLAARNLEQRVTERTRELSTLLEISHEIATAPALDRNLNRILERLSTIVNYRDSAILVFEEERWRIEACQPAEMEEAEDLLISSEETHRLVQAFESGKPVLLNHSTCDEAQSNGFQALATRLSHIFPGDVRTWLGIPMFREDRLIGLFILSRADGDDFPDNQVNVATAFANQAAIEIENNRLIDQVQASAAVEERSRLARELHDSVTQTLYSISIVAEALPRVLERSVSEAKQNTRYLRLMTLGVLAEMRALLFELRPDALEHASLGTLLHQLGDALAGRTRIQVSVTCEDDALITPMVKIAFYRIAQEAMNNIARHSGATQVILTLQTQPDGIILSIQDDGRGFDPIGISAEHMGIRNMNERAEKIGAKLEIDSSPGQGTLVKVIWMEKNITRGRSSQI